MIEWFAGTQQFVLGGVLIWASMFKLGRRAPVAARRSALRKLVGETRAVPAYRAVGLVELLVGALLVTPPVLVVEAYLAVALSVGMLAYLAYAKLRAPEAGCGCLGDKHTPVRGRGFVRAGVLLASGALAAWSTAWWPATLADAPLAWVAVVVAQSAVIVALSPELDHRWLLPLRRWRVRVSHPLARTPVTVPLESSVQQLQRSDAYRSVVGALRSDLLDSWEEGRWRLLTYSADQDGVAATAVFAVPLDGHRPQDIRVALVPESGEVLV
ncbi:MauE/DoxX family redox-associated membrane protein [Actinophytocola xinjiangensis]|nr:MauE/DoxX family redox-associated membrane protein [Actinophytocola xinjiangensis]